MMKINNRTEVYRVLEKSKVVPLFFHSEISVVKDVIEACYKGGGRIFEFTHRGPEALEIFVEIVKWSQKFPGLHMGIGSIVEENLAGRYIDAGARFIISPILNRKVGKLCNRRKVAWIPGCATPSEISQAEEWGAELIKIFPASLLGGPQFVKAIKAPMPWLKIMASGGISTDEKELLEWKNAGVTCLGLGSSLVNTLPDGSFDLQGIQRNIERVLTIMAEEPQ